MCCVCSSALECTQSRDGEPARYIPGILMDQRSMRLSSGQGQWPASERCGGQAKGAPWDPGDASPAVPCVLRSLPCCCCEPPRLGFCPVPESATAVPVSVKVQLCGDTLGPAARAAYGRTEISVAPGLAPKHARAAGKLEWRASHFVINCAFLLCWCR